MERELSIKVEDGGMNDSIAEEVKKDEGGPLPEVSKDETDSEEEIWRGRREIMNKALAASAGGQDPAKAYEYAQILARVIEGGKVDDFLSMINDLNDQLLRDTDWSAVLNSRLDWNGSLLHVAAVNKKDDILRLLVDYVGDHLITAQDDLGCTPLHRVAKVRGSTGAAQMLIRRARDLPNVEDKNLLRMKNKRGRTALHLAMLYPHANLVRYLLSEDMEPVYWKDSSEKSPLYIAVYIHDSAIHEALFSLSLEPSRLEGLPPILGAVIHGRRSLFELILKKNMKLFAMTDSAGANVFHLAAHLKKWVWVFEFLRPETLYLTRERDMNGDLPIHIASKMGHVEHIKKMRKVTRSSNGQGQTVLHIAAKYGRVSVVRYILSNPDLGVLLNEQDNDGNTALHLAVMHSQLAALIHLVRTDGIHLNVYNNEGLFALDIARRCMTNGYKIRHYSAWLLLAFSVAGKGPLINGELLLLKPEARDEELFVVRSCKSVWSRDIVKDYINSRMVVATLVATVTFAAGFAVPGGFNGSDTASKDDRGMATMLDNRMFQAFAICNTIAMFGSMTAVVNLIWAQIVDVNGAVAAFKRTTLPLQIALPAMSTAFLTGVTLTVGKLPWLANTIFYLGLVFLLIISFARFLGKPLIFRILDHPFRRLTFWFLVAYVYVWGVETYIYDDDVAKDNRREKKTFASPPVDVAGESRTDDSAKAKCEDALHPPSH